MKMIHVVGARPNFMKIAPIMRAVKQHGGDEQLLVHTGQHYDRAMSDVFFSDLGLPVPDITLGVGSGSHAEQTAKVMVAFEKVCLEHRPDMVIVVGDVNSTVACALDSAKMGIPCAHVEAGLRSFDMSMPEEVNRVVTDRIADILLTPSADADSNLKAEGVGGARIFRVGNVMIDTLRAHLPRARGLGVLERLGLVAGEYAVVTLHRPSNVDVPETLEGLVRVLLELQQEIPVVFPVHPRTAKRMAECGLGAEVGVRSRLTMCEPMGYLEFLCVTSQAKMVITDSGGLQEETTALGVPCLTVRENTERPVTVTEGTNTVVGVDPNTILRAARDVLSSGGKRGRIPELWDGRAGERVAAVIRGWRR